MLDSIKRDHGVTLSSAGTTAGASVVFDFGGDDEKLPSEMPIPTETELPPEPKPAPEAPKPLDTSDGMSYVRSSYVLRFTGASERYHIRPSAAPVNGTMPAVGASVPAPSIKVEADAEPVAASPEPALMPEDTVVVAVVKDGSAAAGTSAGKAENESQTESDRLIGRTIVPVHTEPVEPAPQPEPIAPQPAEPAEESTAVPEPVLCEPAAEEIRRAPATLPDPEPEPVPIVDETVSVPVAEQPRAVEQGASPQEESRRHATEFDSLSSQPYFKDRFLDTLLSARVTLIAGIVSLAITLLLEILMGLGYFVDGRPSLLFDLDGIFGLYAALLAVPHAAVLLKDLFHGHLVPELLPLCALLLCGGGIVAQWFLPFPAPRPFGVVCAVFSLLLSLSFFLETTGDFIGFKMVSLGVPMLAVRRDATRTLELEHHALDGAVDVYQSRTARVVRIGFLDGFFHRVARISDDKRFLRPFFGTTCLLTLLVGAAAYLLRGEGRMDVLSVVARVFLASVSSVALLARKTSYHAAQKEALRGDSTVIGETSYEEYAKTDVLTFEEEELFDENSIALRNFQLYQSDDIGYAFGRMAAFAGAVGGTLRRVFAGVDAGADVPAPENVERAVGGVSGTVNGKTVRIGTESYMRANGISVPRETAETQTADVVFSLYAAEEGKVFARFRIGAALRPRFAELLPELREMRLAALVLYTHDPFMTEELLSRLLAAGGSADASEKRDMKIRPVPLAADQKPLTVASRMEAGIVTHGTKRNAIRMLHLSKRYGDCQKKLRALAWILLAVGFAASTAACFFLPTFSLYWTGIWQLICAGMSTMLCKFGYFSPKSH